ncbi:MAG: hypothetical protein ACNA8L_09720 [Luteolibacter sp.]|jgi:F-type H+-transporting ATPase subunit epsilon
MIMSLALTIITPERRLHMPSLRQCVFQSPQGETGVLPGHVSFITLTSCGIVRAYDHDARDDAPPISFAVGNGSLRAFDDQLVLLVKRLRCEEEIDVDATQAELDDLTTTLGILDPVLDKETYDDCTRAAAFCEAILRLDRELSRRHPSLMESATPG